MDYYICDYQTHKALRGPMTSVEVVDFINNQLDSHNYCNMSRYLLSKEGTYPRGKKGDEMIAKDMKDFRQKCHHLWYPPDALCVRCGLELYITN